MIAQKSSPVVYLAVDNEPWLVPRLGLHFNKRHSPQFVIARGKGFRRALRCDVVTEHGECRWGEIGVEDGESGPLHKLFTASHESNWDRASRAYLHPSRRLSSNRGWM